MQRVRLPLGAAIIGIFLAACSAAAPSEDEDETSRQREPIADDSGIIECAGFLGLDCPKDLVCVDVPDDGCDPNGGGADCPGMCVHAPSPFHCAGLLGITCPADANAEAAAKPSYACVDDWRDDCDPEYGGADCSGLCLPQEVQPCGGPHDAPCKEGFVCVNDPRVLCVASEDGVAACSTGVCVLAEAP